MQKKIHLKSDARNLLEDQGKSYDPVIFTILLSYKKEFYNTNKITETRWFVNRINPTAIVEVYACFPALRVDCI